MSDNKFEIKVAYKMNKQKKECFIAGVGKEDLLPENMILFMNVIRAKLIYTEVPEVFHDPEMAREPLRSYGISSVKIKIGNVMIPYEDEFYYFDFVQGNGDGDGDGSDMGIMGYPREGIDFELVGDEEKDIPIVLKGFLKEISGSDDNVSLTSLGLSNVWLHTPKGKVLKVVNIG